MMPRGMQASRGSTPSSPLRAQRLARCRRPASKSSRPSSCLPRCCLRPRSPRRARLAPRPRRVALARVASPSPASRVPAPRLTTAAPSAGQLQGGAQQGKLLEPRLAPHRLQQRAAGPARAAARGPSLAAPQRRAGAPLHLAHLARGPVLGVAAPGAVGRGGAGESRRGGCDARPPAAPQRDRDAQRAVRGLPRGRHRKANHRPVPPSRPAEHRAPPSPSGRPASGVSSRPGL